MQQTNYRVEISAEGYETTDFEDYLTAMAYYHKLKGLGLDPEFIEMHQMGSRE